MNKGIAVREKGDYNSALEIFKKALSLNPDNADVLIELGLAYDLVGLTGEAIQTCDRILELNPENSVAYYNRACFKCKIGNIEEALSDLEKSIGFDTVFKNMAKTERDFEKIRGDQRFKDLTA